MNKESKIYIAGHLGMVGSAIVRTLLAKGYKNLIYQSSKDLDLRNQTLVNAYFEAERPEYVFIVAGRVGGIHSNNSYKAEFIYDNIMIAANVINAAKECGVKKLLYMGSSCIYPKFAEQPIKEESLLTGLLEPTNEPYAVAKIAGIKLCQSYRHQYGCNFISCMPTNLYGPGDSYDLNNCHVLPAILRKTIEAKEQDLKEIEIWGSGRPKREFLYVNDLAEATVMLMKVYDEPEHINIGSGEEISILDLAQLIKKVVGYEGELVLNTDKPDGTPRKLLNSDKIFSIGWKPQVRLLQGLTYLCGEHLKESLWSQG